MGIPSSQPAVLMKGHGKSKRGGSRKGALTYFLIDALSALRKTGAEYHTPSSISKHTLEVSRILAAADSHAIRKWLFSFFGSLVVADKPFVSVYRTDDGRLCLAAGGHGVHEGDEYAVHPFGQSDHATAGAE